uniref:Uncharacterized protein n=1 Tax=Arundo donax TaxID=35708 RepID=A0A0A9GXD4_ARUDO
MSVLQLYMQPFALEKIVSCRFVEHRKQDKRASSKHCIS